jgi:hypothetical protein
MNSTVTELKLQRWVDGAIGRDEERELLADCDRHPGQWRRVALAFIEERAMSREFAAEFGAEVRLAAKAPQKPVAQAKPVATSASWLASRQVQQWCAIAASLLLGLLVGNSLHWRLPRFQQQPIANVPKSESRNQGLATDGTSMVEYIPDQSRGERYRMPLLDERTVPASYFDERVELTGIPPEFERVLREHGIELRGRRAWNSYEIEDGEVIVIPTIRFDVRQEGQR